LKKIVVTGGAGFIGSNLVDALVSEGFYVVSIDNYARGDSRNLNTARYKGGFLEVRCDVRDKKTLRSHFEDTDYVFHQAALKNTICETNPLCAFDVNVIGTRNLLELSVEFGVKRFLFASTASVYGRPLLNIIDEYHPTDPMSVYGVTKLAAEKFVQITHKRDGLATTILRYFHVYGPRCDASDETGDVIPIFIRKLANDESPDIHGDGLQERSYTYVGDVVKANLLALEDEEAIGQIYNVASGVKISVRKMTEMLCGMMGKKHIEPVFSEWRKMPEPRRIVGVSHTKIGEIGFCGNDWTPFDIGLRNTILWYTGEGLWRTIGL